VVQTSIKSKTGCGKPVFIHFFAPLDEGRPNDEIDYSRFKKYPSDFDLIANGQLYDYAYKQCLVMSHYISHARGLEILQMKVEFYQDENDFIWFTYARDVYIRANKNKTAFSSMDAKKKAEKILENKRNAKLKLIQELEQFQA